MLQSISKVALAALLVQTAYVSALPPSSKHERAISQPDYVIIGGGAAGFVLAEQLSKNASKSVVLLEAGPENFNVRDIDVPALASGLGNTVHSYNYTSVPQPNNGNRATDIIQGRGFGGSTAINYLLACRGAPSVFDQWANISGDAGLKWSNFENDFKATAHYNEVPLPYNPMLDPSAYGNGPLELTAPTDLLGSQLQFINGSKSALGLQQKDLNAGQGIGVTISTNNIRSSNRTRDFSPQAWGWQLAGRPNAQQLYNAEVTSIGFKGTRAVNVTYINPLNGAKTVLKPKEIIISAGAIGSPKLLLLSGIGPASELKSLGIPVVADIPDVGHNLRDHLIAPMEFEVVSSVETSWQLTENSTFEAMANQEYSYNHTGPLANAEGSAFAAFRAPDSIFSAVNDTFHPGLPADRPQLLIQYATSILMGGLPNVSVVSPFVGLVQPQSYGNVTLASADYKDNPIINSNYFGTAGDVAAILYGYKAIRKVLNSPSFKPLVVKELYPGAQVTSNADLTQAIFNSADSFHHPMGTVSLGKVVEGSTFRVKGVQGLRVVDSSTFPYPPTCQPMLTVYALAYHAAQLIIQQD